MRFSTSAVAATGFVSTANAAIKGFNYGANFNNDQAKTQVDFEYEFNAARHLPGTSGWTSARLYTMIQHGTQNTVIEAIQAAINTKTSLLLGLWASAGQANFDNEITALKSAIAQYGTAVTDLVEGISVGSEDLYRITPTGIENQSGLGAQPQDLINYIQQTRNAIAGTPLAGKPVGHVDTWTVYVNATNNDFISHLDFLGMDAYPYFQTTMINDVGTAGQLFFDALHQTQGAAQGKPVWVTETGWPVNGKALNQAVPNAGNARIFWEDVTCQLVADNVNLWYYTLQDVQYGDPSPSFGIKPAGDLQTVQPLFDLSCPANSNPVSHLLPSVLSSALSPLLFLSLYNLSIAWSLLQYLVPAIHWACDCPCRHTIHSYVHISTWSTRPADWSARTNGCAKRSSTLLPSATTSDCTCIGSRTSVELTTSRTSLPTPTSMRTSATLSVNSIYISSTSVTPPLSSIIPAPVPVPSSRRPVPVPTPSTLRSVPSPVPANLSPGLRNPLLAPSLVVTVDKTNGLIIGNGGIAQLSPTLSPVFAFDVGQEHQGKTCNLIFYMPPTRPFLDLGPVQIRFPGGIRVSLLSEMTASAHVGLNINLGFLDVGINTGTQLGLVLSISLGNQYNMGSMPCPAKQRVALQVDSIAGMTVDFFQMTSPPLGLFIMPV